MKTADSVEETTISLSDMPPGWRHDGCGRRREKEDPPTPLTGRAGPARAVAGVAGGLPRRDGDSPGGARAARRLIDRASLSYEQHQQQSHAADTNQLLEMRALYRHRTYRGILTAIFSVSACLDTVTVLDRSSAGHSD